VVSGELDDSRKVRDNRIVRLLLPEEIFEHRTELDGLTVAEANEKRQLTINTFDVASQCRKQQITLVFDPRHLTLSDVQSLGYGDLRESAGSAQSSERFAIGGPTSPSSLGRCSSSRLVGGLFAAFVLIRVVFVPSIGRLFISASPSISRAQ